jgi:hypothetical protein
MSNIGVANLPLAPLALAGRRACSLAAEASLAFVAPWMPRAHGFVGPLERVCSGRVFLMFLFVFILFVLFSLHGIIGAKYLQGNPDGEESKKKIYI